VERAFFLCRKAFGNEGAAASLENLVKSAKWNSMEDVRSAAPNAKILNGERARFEIAGGNFRMIVAFDFGRSIAFIKFIGTHAEYDRVDALTVSQF
jgi:mRNA interferase HigB